MNPAKIQMAWRSFLLAKKGLKAVYESIAQVWAFASFFIPLSAWRLSFRSQRSDSREATSTKM